MTIQSQTRTAGPFVGSGAVVPYPFNFKVFQSTDMLVVRTNPDGSETTLTMAAEYNVTLNSDQETAPGGIVQLTAGLPSGYSLMVTSSIPEIQKVLLTNQGGFYPRVISDALDYLTILIQQLRGPVSRSLKFPFSDSGMSATLPSATDRANSLLGFDSAGRPVVTVPGSESAIGVGLALASFISDLFADAGSALMGFIQTGVGAVRRTVLDKLRDTINAKDFDVVGDWNGTTGTDNSARLLRAIEHAAATGKTFNMDVKNVGLQSLVISGLNDWKMVVTGSLHSMAAKPATGATDEKDTAGGLLPAIKIDNCTGWTLSGSYLDPRYREAWWITNCSHFENSLEVRGQGLNDNLTGALYRYCTNFRFGQPITAATKKPATGYYQWCNAVTVWDCSNFVVTGKYLAKSNGGNGLYIGSNCKDFVVEDGAICTLNAMSGVQLAWSSFGAFPYRFTIGAMILNGNRADGIDVNNTDPANPIMRIDGKFLGHVCVNNGYNDDGTVSADGSGLGTFMNVSHFVVDDASSTDSARAGLYAKNCRNFYASGFISKQKSTNNLGEGIYLEKCSRYVIDIDCITHPNQEALKLYGEHRDGIIGGNISGVIAISDPDATTSYDNVKLVECNIETTGSVIGNVEIEGGSIRSTGTALYARKNVTNCSVTALNGIALIYAAAGVKVRGGRFVGSNSGTNCTALAYCSLTDAYVEGSSGPASHWINSSYMTITGNKVQNVSGAANAFRVEANCSRIVKFGNESVGPSEFLPASGAYDINF